MKYVIIFILCICCSLQMQSKLPASKGGKSNLALCLDGKDNNVRTGMGILEPSWTLESWIKGNDCKWDSLEVIIGGGEYSELNWVDYLPLVVKKANFTLPVPIFRHRKHWMTNGTMWHWLVTESRPYFILMENKWPKPIRQFPSFPVLSEFRMYIILSAD